MQSNIVLDKYVRYAIVVTGIYRYDVGEPGEFADAQYREDDNNLWTIRWNSVEFNGIGLPANIFDLENHTYTFYVTGQGSPMTFRMYDEPNTYGDNQGELIATIYAYQDGIDYDPYANYVLSYQVGGVENTHTNPATVLGPPSCGTFDLSLGGGWIIVDMGENEDIIDGDGNDLIVYESDPTCSGGEAEAYEVFVGPTPDGPWVGIGSGSGVTGFDIGSSGLSSVRYVKTVDRSPISNPETPGADIDAFEAIHQVDPPQAFSLSLPFSYDYLAHYDDLITSFFDHSFPQAGNLSQQPPDYAISIYTGDVARRDYGICDTDLPAYNLEGGRDCIWYDGHDAYDYGLAPGTHVFAAAPGTISSSQHLYSGDRDLGYQVVITHSDGYSTTYLHIQPADGIDVGVTVDRGDPIGTVERFYYPSHLHFSAKLNGEYTDPYGWYGTTEDPLIDQGGESSRWLWDFSGPLSTTVNLDTGGAILSGSGDAYITVPANVYNTPLVWLYLPLPAASRDELTGLLSAGHSFSLLANDLEGNPVSTLTTPVKIIIFYDQSDIANIIQDTLKLYRWDSAGGSWVPLESAINQIDQNSIDISFVSISGEESGETLHLGTFALLGTPKQMVFLPMIKK